MEELRAAIGLKLCDGIGNITANKLISLCGSASEVFNEKKQHLSKIPGITTKIYELLHHNIDWDKVEKEVVLVEKHHLNYITVCDREYPKNLLSIDSPPIILFFAGNVEMLNTRRCISIVGTRLATGYGLAAVRDIVLALKNANVNIISGLATGIDVAAHKEAMDCSIPTFGVVAHGLKTIYPSHHNVYAKKMIDLGGGIITEYLFEEIPNKENFPTRNRIIAGISEATLVIEAAKKGGALISAELALGYKRKVFALPGRYNDRFSEGCNMLIKMGRARPISSTITLMEELGLTSSMVKKQSPPQDGLSEVEKKIIQLFNITSKIALDNISIQTELNISNCSALLFELELRGFIRSLPGKLYELC